MTGKVQKIREEVERLKGWNNNVRNSTRHMTLQEEDFNMGKHSSYLEILDFIDSLQEEPVSIDFEQELYKAFGQVKDFTLGMRIAKWFYDMGKNSQEPVSDELEDAASRYAKEEYSRKNPATLPDRCICCYAPIMYAFRYGANWQKERMMKEAVKGGCFSYRNGYKHISCDIDEKLTDIKLGDKVKLVIIKED